MQGVEDVDQNQKYGDQKCHSTRHYVRRNQEAGLKKEAGLQKTELECCQCNYKLEANHFSIFKIFQNHKYAKNDFSFTL